MDCPLRNGIAPRQNLIIGELLVDNYSASGNWGLGSGSLVFELAWRSELSDLESEI